MLAAEEQRPGEWVPDDVKPSQGFAFESSGLLAAGLVLGWRKGW